MVPFTDDEDDISINYNETGQEAMGAIWLKVSGVWWNKLINGFEWYRLVK